jgi:uncharacterized membrane protein YfcA
MEEFTSAVAPYIPIGMLAQFVDGTLSMGYGLVSTTGLLTFGLTPLMASASVHAAEVFTTAIAGGAHLVAGNVEWRLVRGLALPGVIGGIIGAYVLTALAPTFVAPLIAAYLLAMGLRILARALRAHPVVHKPRRLVLLGFGGGLLDAMGGGGWGPLVTASLILNHPVPHRVIGSVVMTEFFVTAAISGTFVARIGIDYYGIALGLLIGGIVTAPLAAYFTRRIPGRWLMGCVGAGVTILSARTLFLALP